MEFNINQVPTNFHWLAEYHYNGIVLLRVPFETEPPIEWIRNTAEWINTNYRLIKINR
jgi:hypothetical protein